MFATSKSGIGIQGSTPPLPVTAPAFRARAPRPQQRACSPETRIPIGDHPIGLAYADGSVWVADFGDSAITRIDAATNTVAARTVVPGEHEDVAVGFESVWVPNEEGTVARIDPDTMAPTATIRVETIRTSS